MTVVGGKREHGLEATYRRGCRCQPCKKARRVADQRRKDAREAREAGLEPPTGNVTSLKRTGGPVEQSVQAAIDSIELDVWGAAMAALAVTAAKRVDAGDASPAHFQQVRELLDAVKAKGDPTNATRLGGLAGIIGSRGRVDSRAVSGA